MACSEYQLGVCHKNYPSIKIVAPVTCDKCPKEAECRKGKE